MILRILVAAFLARSAPPIHIFPPTHPTPSTSTPGYLYSTFPACSCQYYTERWSYLSSVRGIGGGCRIKQWIGPDYIAGGYNFAGTACNCYQSGEWFRVLCVCVFIFLRRQTIARLFLPLSTIRRRPVRRPPNFVRQPVGPDLPADGHDRRALRGGRRRLQRLQQRPARVRGQPW